MALKNFSLNISIIFFFIFLSQYSLANEHEASSKMPIKVLQNTDNSNSILLKSHLDETNTKLKELYKLQLDYNKLSIEFIELKKDLDDTRNKRQDLSAQLDIVKQQLYVIKTNSERPDYAAILLTSVAVILTALGVIIAIITFLGYKNIAQKAEDVAREVTTSLISQIANDEISKLIDNGAFESHIIDAVDRVVYKDLYADQELIEEEDADENNA